MGWFESGLGSQPSPQPRLENIVSAKISTLPDSEVGSLARAPLSLAPQSQTQDRQETSKTRKCAEQIHVCVNEINDDGESNT